MIFLKIKLCLHITTEIPPCDHKRYQIKLNQTKPSNKTNKTIPIITEPYKEDNQKEEDLKKDGFQRTFKNIAIMQNNIIRTWS